MEEEYMEVEHEHLEEAQPAESKSFLVRAMSSLKKRIAEKKEMKRKEKEVMKKVYNEVYAEERKKFLKKKAKQKANVDAGKERNLMGTLSTIGKVLDKVAAQAPKPGQKSVGENILEAMNGKKKKVVA